MSDAGIIVAAAILIVATMILEAAVSARRERALRRRGATEPPGDVYRWMRVAYPASFAAIIVEALVRGPAPGPWLAAGALVWVAAKALKVWAIAALGDRWSFRVLVLPGAPVVRSGPYRFLRHPNYVAVAGELAGAAVALAAPWAGAAALAGFGVLLGRRIVVEERALGIR